MGLYSSERMTRRTSVALTMLFVLLLSPVLRGQSQPGAPQPGQLQKRAEEIRKEALPAEWEQMKPLFAPMKPPVKGEWLAEHREDGQSLQQFQRRWQGKQRDRSRGFVDIVLIGAFTPGQRRALDLSLRHIEACFGVRTRLAAEIADAEVAAAGRRLNPGSRQLQFHTEWIHENLLKQRLKEDSICLLGFTATDLFPRPDWNFVFGIAYSDGIGLWSIARNGKAEGTEEERRLFLRRTISTATHETGHLFGLHHCIAYECLINGSNHRAESDAKPLVLCPSCSAKMAWLWKLQPADTLQSQLKLCREIKLADAEKTLKAELDKLGVKP